MFNPKKIQKICNILSKYNGSNNQILYYKSLYNKGLFNLNDFNVNYIEQNYKYKPFEVNRIIKISSDFGKYLQDKYKIEFTPTKLYIGRVIGEIGNSYHCYAQFRKSVGKQLMYISRNYLLSPLKYPNENEKINIDFDFFDKKTEKYDRKLKEHQKIGIEFLLKNKKCILADQQGLGKTTQAIVASIAGGFNNILVVTTASLKTTWKKEIAFYEDEENISIINGSDWEKGSKFTIVNYDILQKFYHIAYEEVTYIDENTNEEKTKLQKSKKKKYINECLSKSQLFTSNFDCVIIDEAQKLSNKTSIRYKTINDFLHTQKPKAIFLLTGTPLTNRPINLYNILSLIDADVTRDYSYYSIRYCDGREMKLKSGKKILINNGASHLDELKEKIKHLYIRRLQSDIPGMVKKNVITKEYELNSSQKEIYSRLWNEYVQSQKLKGNDDVELYKDLVEGIIVRQYLAKEMTKNTIDLCNEKIEYGEKVIIVCTFQEEIDIFKEYYGKKAVIYNGKMTLKKKDKSVDSFMNNPDIMVMIANLTAVSLGLSLTVCNYLIFNSYSWQAAENDQAMDRIYRITQKRDVVCVYQLFNDSISKSMFEKVMFKKKIMNETIKSENEK